jgi:hypothetical protein
MMRSSAAARLLILTVIGSIVTPLPSMAQSATVTVDTTRPPANPSDVSSVDAIITALYASISGAKGEPRDFVRMRSLFAPNALMVATGRRADGSVAVRSMSPAEYEAVAGPGLVAGGFFEREIGRTMQSFGQVTHVMSAYDSKRTLADPAPFSRGVNSIQLFHDGTRWYIVSILWDSERPDNPIPPHLLTGGGAS